MSADYVAPPLTVGSLFSGIGGIDLGLERAGFEVRWQAEMNPYASQVLAKHWPDVPNLGDITKIDWENDGYGVDLVAGGFPCQPVSLAGRRLAQLDARWLWPEFARCVRLLRPRFVLVENVPGLLVRGMGDVLRDLATLGYDAEWQGIPAAAVGAPHLRWRIFVVAHTNGQQGSGRREQQPSGSEGERDVADAQGVGLQGRSDGNGLHGTSGSRRNGDAVRGSDGTLTVGDSKRLRLEEPRVFGVSPGEADPTTDAGWWAVEPDVGRVANGVPRRVDRLRCLGNAVVPQVAEYVGRRLLAYVGEPSGLAQSRPSGVGLSAAGVPAHIDGEADG